MRKTLKLNTNDLTRSQIDNITNTEKNIIQVTFDHILSV